MKGKTFSGLILVVLLTGILTSTFNIQPVKASGGTIYIRADGSVDPSTAPILNVGNVYYTFTADIHDSIVVQRDNIVVDGAGYTIQGLGDGKGINLAYRSNVTNKNMEIRRFRYGIYLNFSSNNLIQGNNMGDSWCSIYLNFSSNNLIQGNNVTANGGVGVWLSGSSSNNIAGNNITNNIYGIILGSSSNNTVSGNTITNNGYGIYLISSSNNTVSGNTFINDGLHVYESYENVVVDNTVNGKPLIYLEEVQNYSVGDAGQVILVNCNNITVQSLTISNTDTGVQLLNSNNCSIVGNTITNNGYGIYLTGSSNNTVSENNITANNDEGVYLMYSSNNIVAGNVFVDDGLTVFESYDNVVVNNVVNGKPLVYLEDVSDYVVGDAGQVILVKCTRITVKSLSLSNTDTGVHLWNTSNTEILNNDLTNNDFGVWLDFSSNNIISGNSIAENNYCSVGLYFSSNNLIQGNNMENTWYGVWLGYSSNNLIQGNNVTASSVYGVSLHYSSSNVVSGNNITNNDEGVYLWQSSNNTFYHNNFIDNIRQVYSVGLMNGWDDGYPSGGNYWSDYTERYPNAAEIGDSGIWDTPYVINENNTDHYPLVNPWTPPPDFSITVSPTSLTIQQGSSDTSIITVTSTGGFDQPVQLTVSGAPSGVTATLNPEQITPPPDGATTSTLTVSVDTTAALGSYTLTVTGTSGTLTHGKDITLEIKTLSEKFLTLPFKDPDVVVGWIFDPTQQHYGIDFIKCSDITDVFTWESFDVVAAADGEAFWAEEKDPEGNYKGWGKYVYIKHYEKDTEGRNYYTLYAHLESVDPNIPKEGDGTYTIQRGELIGRAGAIGVADPSWIHLHFEVHEGDARSKDKVSDRVDPYDLNQDRDSRYGEKATSIRCGPNYLWATDPPSQPSIVKLVITSPLEITPFKDIYYVGDTLTAKFTITNRGTESVTFNVLVVGGRDPAGEVVDSDKAYGITLNPSDSYDYQGSLTLSDKHGIYHFFCAYQTLDGNWNTNIDVEIDGKIVEDFNEARRHRERDIIAFEKTYVSPAPPPALWEKISGPWEAESWDKWACLSQIAVHPNDPEVIYAVVEEHHYYLEYQGDKLYKTVNGGADWNPINEGLPLEGSLYWSSIGAMAIAPSNPYIIYIGTSARDTYSGLTSSAAGIYRSTNGGQEWESIGGPYTSRLRSKSYYSISSMIVNPANPDIVYAGTVGGGIWRTTNGGGSWERIWELPAQSLDVNTLAISSVNPNIIYAAAYNFDPLSAALIPNCLIKSEDGGSNWETLLSYWKKIDDIAVDNRNADIVYVITEYFEVYRSIDGGKNWDHASGTAGADPLPSPQYLGPTLGRSNSMVLHPHFSDVIYAARMWESRGVYFSPSSGENWYPFGLEDNHVQEIVFASNADSHVLYAAASDGLFKIDLSEGLTLTRLRSPGELRVYDSQGRVTGWVNGEVREEIPNSAYNEENRIVTLIFPTDSYRYEVAGTDQGTYGLAVISITEGEAATFTATDIPTSANEIHQYTINWAALSLGEEGVTLQIDSDGDGAFEQTITADTELTHCEFMLQTATVINFDPDALDLWSEGSWITVYIELPEGYNVSDIDVSTILLNGTIPVDPDAPTAIGDYDNDGILDLMVKFNRTAVTSYIINEIGYPDKFATVTLTVTGQLIDDTPFEGSDTIKIIDPRPHGGSGRRAFLH